MLTSTHTRLEVESAKSTQPQLRGGAWDLTFDQNLLRLGFTDTLDAHQLLLGRERNRFDRVESRVREFLGVGGGEAGFLQGTRANSSVMIR